MAGAKAKAKRQTANPHTHRASRGSDWLRGLRSLRRSIAKPAGARACGPECGGGVWQRRKARRECGAQGNLEVKKFTINTVMIIVMKCRSSERPPQPWQVSSSVLG